MAQFGFNPAEVPESENSFDPIPAGDYKVEIVESEVKVTNDSTGSYINFRVEVAEGPFAGRVLWDMAMIQSSRTDDKMQKALQIAREKIASMCKCVGRPAAQDSNELHNIPMIASVRVKDDPQHGPKNEIKAYKSAGVVTPGNPQANAQQTPTAHPSQTATASPSDEVPPWKRAG